ncbi:hypothetical protein GZH53_15835 [Flavihumibacter sp. R14]|nr:hypothetical protein [Flavihumibacter soli]
MKYSREVTRNPQGIYILNSKGREYWFRKDFESQKKNYGWVLINGTSLPEEFLEQICSALQTIYIYG